MLPDGNVMHYYQFDMDPHQLIHITNGLNDKWFFLNDTSSSHIKYYPERRWKLHKILPNKYCTELPWIFQSFKYEIGIKIIFKLRQVSDNDEDDDDDDEDDDDYDGLSDFEKAQKDGEYHDHRWDFVPWIDVIDLKKKNKRFFRGNIRMDLYFQWNYGKSAFSTTTKNCFAQYCYEIHTNPVSDDKAYGKFRKPSKLSPVSTLYLSMMQKKQLISNKISIFMRIYNY